MNIIKKITIVLVLIIALICLFTKVVKASDEDIINTDNYSTSITYEEGEYFFNKAARVLTVLRAISVIVAVLCISILGVKYMVGSLDEKAQYKEKMLPIVIGAILIGSISTILITISNIMNS